VAVVNEAFVAEYWPGEDPLGKRIKFDSEDDPWIEVIGVCADYKMNTVGEAAAPMVHTALLQQEAYFETIIARTAGDPAPIVVRMSEEISARDPDVSFFSSGTMAQNLTTVLLPVRLGAALLAVFGLLALGLAAVGVYGVIAYTVARRTHEIGVRMALGARSNDVLRLVVWQSMRVVLVGVALGALGAAAVASTLGAFLYDISAIDPLTFLGTIAILLGVALLANYIPARRGARIDPMVALKTE
jgi:putative ABC transport system permease protein